VSDPPVDLVLDLNSEDDTWLPWGFVDEASDPALIQKGAWILVGSGTARAVAQVADVEGEIVHVRPLPGPASRIATPLNGAPAETQKRR
jgi:hypothetical protein